LAVHPINPLVARDKTKAAPLIVGVILMAATNTPEALDPALLRA